MEILINNLIKIVFVISQRSGGSAADSAQRRVEQLLGCSQRPRVLRTLPQLPGHCQREHSVSVDLIGEL